MPIIHAPYMHLLMHNLRARVQKYLLIFTPYVYRGVYMFYIMICDTQSRITIKSAQVAPWVAMYKFDVYTCMGLRPQGELE